MKSAVVVVAIGPYHQSVFELTKGSMKSYADKIGADFVAITESSGSTPDPEMEKLQAYTLLNKYHRLIILDADVAIRGDCPNLFDVVPMEQIGAFNEGFFGDATQEMSEACKHFSVEIPKWERQYYNTGVLVVSRQHKFLFQEPDRESIGMFEQLINLRLIKGQAKIKELPYKFNRMTFADEITGEPRHASYIMHYAGASKSAGDRIVGLITSDMEKWQAAAPEYKFRRNILVKTHGGIGDEVCAEPVIRYMVEKVYKEANITVATWFPRLYDHLPVRICKIGEFKPEFDTPYYVMETLFAPEHPSWKYISANLMNTTDFASICCLRSILPDADKQIKLRVGLDDMAEVLDVTGAMNLSELVLVHPGKGWDSKSFPAEYWTEVIAKLAASGYKVAIIGKDVSEDQGTVDIGVPDGVMDLRNLLSLGGLIALISAAKVLISNDSSPIHIAGAFDNHIVLIPTCKHPDHVLPVRKGDRYYKARALHKKLLWSEIDSTPTQIHGQTIDKVPGDIMDFLPEAEQIVDAVSMAFREQDE